MYRKLLFPNLVYFTAVGTMQSSWTQIFYWIRNTLFTWTIIPCPTLVHDSGHACVWAVVSPSTVDTLCFFIETRLVRKCGAWTRNGQITALWTVRAGGTLDESSNISSGWTVVAYKIFVKKLTVFVPAVVLNI